MGIYDDVYVALSEAGVRFVVVGGTAVVLQGHARMTVDLDLVIDLAAEPAAAGVAALSSLGLLPRLPVPVEQFADPAKRQQWVEQRNLMVFSLYDPDSVWREVDLFATDPLPFDELWDEATVVELGGVPVRVASRRHLVAMKRSAGRPRDLDDVAALLALEGP